MSRQFPTYRALTIEHELWPALGWGAPNNTGWEFHSRTTGLGNAKISRASSSKMMLHVFKEKEYNWAASFPNLLFSITFPSVLFRVKECERFEAGDETGVLPGRKAGSDAQVMKPLGPVVDRFLKGDRWMFFFFFFFSLFFLLHWKLDLNVGSE